MINVQYGPNLYSINARYSIKCMKKIIHNIIS